MKTLSTVVAVAILPGLAMAEISLLDIPSGEQNSTNFEWSSQSGLMRGFDVSSEHMNFQDLGHWATPGNIFAYDYSTNSSQVGSVLFTADAGNSVSLRALDVSGWASSYASAELRIIADGELVFEEFFEMRGKIDFANLAFESIAGSEIRVELENVANVGVGLDNFVIETSAVPAPGVLALLGVAGIVGSRRRRG